MDIGIFDKADRETIRREISYEEKEMRRMCGAVPKETIDSLKDEMSAFIAANREALREIEKQPLPAFDHHGYKDRYNHIELTGPEVETSTRGFYGAECIISDIKALSEEDRKRPITDIVPPILLNDLVVKTVDKNLTFSGKRRIVFDTHRYDPERELLYYCKYELKSPERREVEKPKTFAPLASGITLPSKETEIIPAHLEIINAAIIPLRWVTTMLIVGMNGKWEDLSFVDYPIFMAWFDSQGYMLYRDFIKTNLSEQDEHGVLKDILEASVGFQRYLVKLSEDREKVSIEKEKKARTKASTDKAETDTVIDNAGGNKKPDVKHIITLDNELKIYTNTNEAVKRFKHIQKCPYRYSVRGHFRHYKNGKVVWVKSFDKNKDKPFNSHNYGTGIAPAATKEDKE